jgi:hypothetical protein
MQQCTTFTISDLVADESRMTQIEVTNMLRQGYASILSSVTSETIS